MQERVINLSRIVSYSVNVMQLRLHIAVVLCYHADLCPVMLLQQEQIFLESSQLLGHSLPAIVFLAALLLLLLVLHFAS